MKKETSEVMSKVYIFFLQLLGIQPGSLTFAPRYCRVNYTKMKYSRYIGILALLFPIHAAFSQHTATTSADGDWTDTGLWSFSAGFMPNGGYPDDDFDEDGTTLAPGGDFGEYIIIDANNNIKIPNNVTINLFNSGVRNILIRSGAELHFGSNSKLVLPAGATITVESGAIITVDSNSGGTYLEIGGNGIWGRQCEPECNNDTLTGPGTITEDSDPASPLPVKLLYFRVDVLNQKVALKWGTATESNADYFAIERSSNGQSFREIGREAAAGNSAIGNEYSFDDNNPFIGRAYYRLKAVDLDGTSEYFNLVVADFEGKRGISIYPNPLQDEQLNVSLNFANDHPAFAVITDMSGFELCSLHFTGPVLNMPLSLSAGTYLIKVRTENEVYVSRFVVK